MWCVTYQGAGSCSIEAKGGMRRGTAAISVCAQDVPVGYIILRSMQLLSLRYLTAAAGKCLLIYVCKPGIQVVFAPACLHVTYTCYIHICQSVSFLRE